MEKIFRLKEHHTTVSTEITAGLTTFFAMAYIIAVNPAILSQTGMEWGAVFLATIIAAAVGTLIMGLAANVPYAQAPGMGLNAFFTYTICFGLGFSWQQALAMVFICGLINILITVTKVRKSIIRAIPDSLQHAIGGGIGIFIAYVGLLNVGIIKFTPDSSAPASAVPGLAGFSEPVLWVFLIGLVLTVVFCILQVRGGILLSIIITTLIGILFGVTKTGDMQGVGEAVLGLPKTFGAIFRAEGIPSLFNDISKLPLVLTTIFTFSMSDIFDTIGTFIGTGRKAEIFSGAEEGRMGRALFADAAATSLGAVFGTSNTTTYTESAVGIAAGGRTGLTSVVTALCFLISAFFAPLVSAVPFAATAPVLVVVGCMMLSAFSEINWKDLCEAVPAFFTGIFMAFSYSVSYGIAAGFIMYCIVKTAKKQWRDIHPVLLGIALLFVLNFVLRAVV